MIQYGRGENMIFPTMLVILLVIVIFTVVILFLLNNKTKSKKLPDYSKFITLLNELDVKEISFIRNKINIKLATIEDFDPLKLKQAGASGVSVVGNTVKFYIEGESKTNEMLYQELKRALNR